MRLFLVRAQWISWSPDSQQIAVAPFLRVCGLDGSVSPFFTDDDGRAHGPMAWHPDGEWIASTLATGGIRLFKPDGTAGRQMPGSENGYSSLAWTPDGSRLAAVHFNDIQQWTLDGTPGELLHGRGGLTNTIAWGPDSQRIAVLDKQYLKLLDVDGTEAKSIDVKRSDHQALSWSPDGKTIAVAGHLGGTITLLTPDGEERAVIDSLPGNVLAWSPDSRWLATTYGPIDAGTIRLWTPDGKPGPIFNGLGSQTNVLGGVNSVAWNRLGTQFATTEDNGSVRVWNADGSAELQLTGNRHAAKSISWSPDGSKVVAGGSYPGYIGREIEGGAIWIWSLDDPTTPIPAADDLQAGSGRMGSGWRLDCGHFAVLGEARIACAFAVAGWSDREGIRKSPERSRNRAILESGRPVACCWSRGTSHLASNRQRRADTSFNFIWARSLESRRKMDCRCDPEFTPNVAS